MKAIRNTIIGVIILIILIAGIFLYERSKVSFHNEDENEIIIGGSDGPTSIIIKEGNFQKNKDGYISITMAEAKAIFENGVACLIVDVRRPDEYAEGHIPGAINIANENIDDTEPKELPDKNQIIYVYCRSGNRSKQASKKLAEMGYTNIIEFGGILDWTGETEVDE